MISIITPVYNGEYFIESCIKIFIQQACSNAEHIIVDGGSTDGTVDTIRQYAEQYPHIRWISEKDKGQSDAMNKGIKMAKGEIVSFLNVDDYYEANTLNRVSDLFETLPTPSFLAGNCNVLKAGDELIEVNKPSKLTLFDMVIGIGVHQYPYNPSAYFYHKALHDAVGLFDVNDHYSMDIDFIFRAVQEAHVKYVDETFGNFRLIEGTKTFKDLESELIGKRVRAVFDKFRQQLPIHQRSWIYLREERLKFMKNLGRLQRAPQKFKLVIAKFVTPDP